MTRNRHRSSLSTLALCAASLLAASSLHAAVLPMTSATFDKPLVNLSGTYYVSSSQPATSIVTYTTAAGTRSDLHPISQVLAFSNPDGSPSATDHVQNWWVGGGTAVEIDGPDAMLGLDVTHGLVNTAYLNVSFDATLHPADEIFITELGGNDNNVVVKPLDAAGNTIGDFSLTLTTTSPDQWGTIVNVYTYAYDTGTASFQPIAGVAFNVSDFTGTGSLTAVSGLRIESGTLDPSVIGYVLIPEPATISLLSAAVLLFTTPRRRRHLH